MNPDYVYFQIEPTVMTQVTRIIEGYGYLGVVTALDGKKGIGFVRTTPDTNPITKEILQALPFPVTILTMETAVTATAKQ